MARILQKADVLKTGPAFRLTKIIPALMSGFTPSDAIAATGTSAASGYGEACWCWQCWGCAKIRILNSGYEAHSKVISEIMVCTILVFMWSFWPLASKPAGMVKMESCWSPASQYPQICSTEAPKNSTKSQAPIETSERHSHSPDITSTKATNSQAPDPLSSLNITWTPDVIKFWLLDPFLLDKGHYSPYLS